MIERRKYKRFLLELTVDYGSDKLLQLKKTKNLSLGGVFIETDAVEPVGTKARLSFYWGADEVLEAEGAVVWNRAEAEKKGEIIYPPGMGIQFTKMNISLKGKLEEKTGEILKT